MSALGWLLNLAFRGSEATGIDTTDQKLALMEWCQVWEPALPIEESDPFDQGDKQQMLWGYPGILWQEAAAAAASIYIPRYRRRARL